MGSFLVETILLLFPISMCIGLLSFASHRTAFFLVFVLPIKKWGKKKVLQDIFLFSFSALCLVIPNEYNKNLWLLFGWENCIPSVGLLED